jgi:transposase
VIVSIGIDIGSTRSTGHDRRDAIVMQQKCSCGQLETRNANLPPRLISISKLSDALKRAIVYQRREP